MATHVWRKENLFVWVCFQNRPHNLWFATFFFKDLTLFKITSFFLFFIYSVFTSNSVLLEVYFLRCYVGEYRWVVQGEFRGAERGKMQEEPHEIRKNSLNPLFTASYRNQKEFLLKNDVFWYFLHFLQVMMWSLLTLQTHESPFWHHSWMIFRPWPVLVNTFQSQHCHFCIFGGFFVIRMKSSVSPDPWKL